MATTINFITRQNNRNFQVNFPDYCPYCQKNSILNFIHGATVEGSAPSKDVYKLTVKCSNNSCNEIIIAAYRVEDPVYPSDLKLVKVIGGEPTKKLFSDIVNKISPSFVRIYNQAEVSEHYGLTDICGVGYRKAFEFLVKDDLIKDNPTLEPKIKKDLLGECIKSLIKDQKVKDLATRIAWLGNDETHYERKWIDKDLSDLKNLINLMIHYIESNDLYEQTMKTMPSGKP